MKKVLHIVSSWGTGGVERYIYNYSQYLKKYSFDVLTLRESSSKSIFSSDKINVYHLENVEGNFLKRLNKRKKLLIEFMKKHNYEIVHFDMTTADAFILAKTLKKNFSCKVIMHCHATNVEPPNIMLKKLLHYYSKIFYSKYADYYIALSEETKKWMFPKRSNNKGTILNCGIEIDKFKYSETNRKQIREKYELSNKYVLGTVGRFSQQKNPFFILDIIQEYSKKDKDFKFLWIGEGRYFENIKKEADNRKINKYIIFVGNSNKVEEFYSAMDIFILPSLYEGNPISCIEAQTNGLKCIISNKITTRCNITGQVVFLKIEDTIEWVKKLEEMKNECNHTSDLEKIIQSGFSVKDNARKLEEIYDELEK